MFQNWQVYLSKTCFFDFFLGGVLPLFTNSSTLNTSNSIVQLFRTWLCPRCLSVPTLMHATGLAILREEMILLLPCSFLGWKYGSLLEGRAGTLGHSEPGSAKSASHSHRNDAGQSTGGSGILGMADVWQN